MILAFAPRRRCCMASGPLTNLSAGLPNLDANLTQPVCGSAVSSTTAEPIWEAGTYGQVVVAKVDVDYELVASEFPSRFRTGDCVDETGVNDRKLCIRIGGAVRSAGTASGFPVVAGHALFFVEYCLFQLLALADCGACGNHLEHSAVGR